MNELEFSIVYEILTAVEFTPEGQRIPQRGFTVETVADRISPIETSHGIKIFPHKGTATSLRPNILIVTGGPGARRPHIPQGTLDWLAKGIETADVVCGVSSGIYIVGRAGLIHNRRVTTHFSLLDDLHRLYPRATVMSGQRVTTDGRNLMSCGGGTAAIDLALGLVHRFYGHAVAAGAAKRIEYTPPGAV